MTATTGTFAKGVEVIKDIEIIEPRLRLDEREAQAALNAVRGRPVLDALAKLRIGPGRICEPVARVLDKAVVRAEATQKPLDSWIVVEGTAQAEEDIIRVRRSGYGPSDWIRSPACRVQVLLQTVGEPPPPTRSPPSNEPVAHHSIPPTSDHQVTAIHEALLEVIDPDLGVNIIDLGFVRAVSVKQGTASITMTLTSAACPLSAVIERQVVGALAAVSGVNSVHIDWRWLPAWKPSDITDSGREQLRSIGFSI
jgi:metal-sulfur cluster biosynthetic enzyme